MTLLGGNQADLARLLQVCEAWSHDVGIRFSPAKCVYLGPIPVMREVPLRIYGQDIVSKEVAPYLGIPFGRHGINWLQMAKERTQKARGVIVTMAALGMNATGWAPASSAKIYRSFIRPVMEYGVALKIPSREALKLYESVQNLALRTMVSVPRNTSIKALHKLLHVEPFDHRAKTLNAMWGAHLHNSTDRTMPAVRIWRNALVQAPQPNQVCLPRLLLSTNTIWNHPDAVKLDHATNPLADPVEDAVWADRLFDRVTRRRIRREAVAVIENALDNVAGAILIEPSDKIRPYLTGKSGINRKTRNTVMRWTLGAVAWHRPCLKCGQELSRVHAAECSGADALLAARHPEVLY
ncbi:hypothetical protein HDU83_008163 [Entophlyctis luteolus]|nr:hypothetical protein HDU83_008163 [Entophlyctis luteolus]